MSQTDKTLTQPSFDQPEAQPLTEAELSAALATPAAPPPQTRPWPASVLALLLLLQAVGLFDLGLFFFSGGLGVERSLLVEKLIAEPINALAMGIVFIPLALLALLAAIGFFWLWRTAWLMAMLLQGFSLLTALVLYFNQKPAYVYVIMLYGIIMVIYLNYFHLYAVSPLVASLDEEDEE